MPSLVPCFVTGFVAVLIGFASTAVLIFQAAHSAGATPEQMSSWITAICLGMGATGIAFSWRYRIPILTAWSTPGIALLVHGLVGVPMSEAIGAFLSCGFLITLFGVTGWYERAMKHVPVPIASAMLAGILLQFGLNVFGAMRTELGLVLPMFLALLLFKRVLPRYAILAVLVIGITLARTRGLLHFDGVEPRLGTLVFVRPSFSVRTFFDITLPLFIVTMASQNLASVAALRAFGYSPRVSPLIAGTGLATLLLAPFGAFAVTLAAVTAAIGMSPDTHPDPARRYWTGIATGAFYLLAGLFGGTVVALFAAFPKELIVALSGLALLATIGGSLAQAMREEAPRDAALITFLVTASGFELFGVGAAFWGLIAGGLAIGVRSFRGRA